MEENKEEWMNPESPKYYKGFRYEKDEYGNEFWCNNSQVRRKEIRYDEKGVKRFIVYRNESNYFHNEDGYALIEWDENSKLIAEEYWLNAKQISKDEWEKNRKQHLNPESENYYKGFNFNILKDKDILTWRWYDENNICRRNISFYVNGKKRFEDYWNESKKYHNEEGFAYQIWYEDGSIKFQDYFLNGKKLSQDEWKEKTIISYKFEKVVKEYIELFNNKHDIVFDGWVGDDIGEVAVFNEDTYYINFSDIRYDIDNKIESSLFKKWYFESMEQAQSSEEKYINYKSYIMGLRYNMI